MVIGGATGAGYRIVAADVGAQLAVQVRAAKDGYETAVERVAVIGLVRASAILELSPSVDGRAVSVTAKVTVPGTQLAPTGQVTVTVDGRSRLLDVVSGRASSTWRRLDPGEVAIEGRYAGTTDLFPAEATNTAQVG